jgi:hypothetical protein
MYGYGYMRANVFLGSSSYWSNLQILEIQFEVSISGWYIFLACVLRILWVYWLLEGMVNGTDDGEMMLNFWTLRLLAWVGYHEGNFHDEDVNEVRSEKGWWIYDSTFVGESQSQMEVWKDENAQVWDDFGAQHHSPHHRLVLQREE